MAEARARSAWAHTSSVMALLANCHGVAKSPADYNPFAQPEEDLVLEVGVDVLKTLFVDPP